MYGQTEATARLTYLPPERLSDKLGFRRHSDSRRRDHRHPMMTTALSVPVASPAKSAYAAPNVMLGYWP